MLKKSIAWLLTLALCMSIFAGCGNKDVTTDVPVDNTVVDDSVTSTDDTDSDTLVITTAGNVTPNAGVKNVVIEADGVILENASLDSITISPKLGDGTATLKNVKVKTLDANGGGEHSLIINDCEVVTLVANREEGKLHITISVGSTVKTFTISSEVLADIEGGVDNLVVEDTATDPKVNILATSRVKDMLVKALTQIKIDAKVDSVSVTGDAKGSEIEVTKDGKLTKLSTDVPVTTSGEGEIDELVTDDEENMNGSTLKPNETTIDEAPVKNNGAKPTPTPKVNASQKPYVKPSPTAAPTVVPTPTAPPIPSKPVDPVIPTTPPVLGNTADLGVVSSIVAFNDLANGITSGTHEIVADKTLISAIMNGIFAAENATYKIVAAGTTCTTPAEYNALTAAQVKKGTDKFATGDHIYVLSQDGKTLKDYTITAGAAKTLIDDSFTIMVSDATYTGIIAAPTVTIEKGGSKLVLDKDYSLIVPVKVSDVAQDNINVGTCKVVIVGKGTYCGDILKDLKIVPKAITIADAAKSCDGKVYDGNNNVTADNLDVTLDGVVGPALVKGTDYKVTGTFEDANVGVNKKINVAVTMLNTKAAKNFTLTPATKLVTSTAAITPKAVGNKANKATDSVAYNANGIDLAQFFTPDTKAGVASYEVATTQPDSGVGAVAGSTLTVTTCGKFTVTMKTAASADGNYAADTKGVSFVLTVEKTAGVAIAETLDTVKTTTVGGTDGKITGLSNAKLYEYKKGTDAYAKVAANATEITGLVAGTYTVRYQETNTVAAGIEKTITVADPKKSEVSLAKMLTSKDVLGKKVSDLQADNVAFVLNDKTFKATGSIKEITEPWLLFENINNTGYFMAFEVNGAEPGTTFVLHNSGTGGNKTVDLNVDNEFVFNLGKDAGVHKTITFEVDLDGAGLEYEKTTYTVDTSALQLQKAAKLTITNKVDGKAAANAKAITLKKENTGAEISVIDKTNGVYEATGLMNGTYNIWVNGIDTGKSVLVNGVDTTFDLEYLTVTLTNPGDGQNPIGTLKASVNGANVASGDKVLKGTNVTLTAAVNAPDPTATYSYTFKNNKTIIVKQTTDAEDTRTFALNEKLDATVEIILVTTLKAVTDLNVTAPVKFVNALVATKGEGHYTVTSTTWKNNETVETGKFLANAVYTATIILTADANYTFEDCAPTGATLNGGTVTSHSINNSNKQNQLTVVISYPKTAEAVLPTIDKPVIVGTLKAGGTLSVTPSNYVGNDGGANASYEYNWFKIDSDVGNTSGTTPRLLGTNSTYIVNENDIGWIISVTVVPVGTENGLKGNAQMSAGTNPVPKKTPNNSAKNPAASAGCLANGEIEVSKYFEADLNAGKSAYSIVSGGTGEGSINGTKLKVTKAGTFIIKMTTEASYFYEADNVGVTCTLTVDVYAPTPTPTIIPTPSSIPTSSPSPTPPNENP